MQRYAFILVATMAVGACSSETPTSVLPDEDDMEDAFFPVLAWPMGGTEGEDWVINNYVDLSSFPSILDYQGGEKAYDGHNGIDIDVPNFRWMDADFPILAAAPGTVTAVRDGEFDRNVSCVGTWNFVEVTLLNNARAIYGHLKNGSVAISVGDAVTTGQTLGVVGSSGCSTQAHLHFELRQADGTVVDPFEGGHWVSPPAYTPPLTLSDVYVKDGAITGFDEMKDPPANITELPLGNELAVGMSMAGGVPGDVIGITFRTPGGALHLDGSRTLTEEYRHTYWWWQRVVNVEPGAWTVTISINGNVASTFSVDVVS
jgi:murein DD-endopeptidase MepM/ murein hydrolase activator NlpD